MSYEVERFQGKLERAIERVKLVLDTNRVPCFAADVHHQYQDKFTLAESMTNAALASQVNALASIGLSLEQLEKMRTWTKTSAVSLRFQAEERCEFLREEKRDVESATKQVTEATGWISGKVTSKTVTTVTEYFWKYETSYELMAVRGVGQHADDQICLLKRDGQVELKTAIKESPHPANRVPAEHAEINVSWLVKLLELESGSVVPHFSIDRANAKCHTPRRNPDIIAAGEHCRAFRDWTAQVTKYLVRLLSVKDSPDSMDRRGDLGFGGFGDFFIPLHQLPLFEDKEALPVDDAAACASAAREEGSLLACLAFADASGSALGSADTNRFLSEEARALQETREKCKEAFQGSSGGAVATAAEATLAVTLLHCSRVCESWEEAVEYIENMLRKQLIAAIGKEVTPTDFAEYMTFHNRKLFADAYAPVPFCFAVRRSDKHGPEGTLSIEQETVGGDSNIPAPIVSLVAHSSREHKMEFPLSASANITFGGDKYLHAWLSHKFSGESGASLSLVSRARQFSSFIVLVGRISSAKTFDPKYAAIVQNKDELKIPLDLSTIPTPKEFKDAIESLSPEQQAFAKAFRSMQLESTLFGILVIQIKPQLERVLRLPDDSLTKEIKLTQELMQLFIKYQIPSDLLAFDANESDEGMQLVNCSAAEKLTAVKGHVKAMYDMIGQSQKEEVQQRQMEELYEQPIREHPQYRNMELQQESLCMSRGDSGDFSSSASVQKRSAPTARRMMNALSAGPQALARSMAGDRGDRGVAFSAAPEAMTYAAPMARFCDAAPMAGASMPMADPAMSAPQNTPQPQQQQQPQQPQQGEPNGTAEVAERDYTQVPKDMDANFERLDTDSQLRPTIITPSGSWTKRAQKALLASPTTSMLDSDAQKAEKDAAFDLLDALTKSGAVSVDNASLHIVVAATHCFDKSVTETVIQDNVNPVDKVERSTLIMASTVHQLPTAALIRDAQLPRVKAASPMLFDDAAIDVH